MATSFVVGSRRLYDFVHDNPYVELHPCDRTNDTAIIRAKPKVTAINSALEIIALRPTAPAACRQRKVEVNSPWTVLGASVTDADH